MYQVAALGDTVYFGLAVNDTGGSATDGSSAVASVRLCGTGADVAPLVTVAGTLLSHATYPAGAYEIAIAATEANGYAANQHYAVYATAAVDGENPIGHLGTFYLTAAGETPLLAAIRTLTALPNAAAGGASGLALHNGEMDLVDAPNSTAVTAIQNGLALASGVTVTSIATDAITANALAADAITEIGAGIEVTDVTVTALGTDTITAASISADAATKIATGIEVTDVTVTGLGTNAITANVLAADAVAEIQSGLALASGVTVTSIATDAVNANALATDAVTEIQSGLALASGVTVTSIGTNALAANAVAADAVTELQSGLATAVDLAVVAVDVAAINAKTTNIPALPAAADDIPTAAAIADAVLEEAVAGHKSVAGSLAAVLNAMWRRMGFGYIARDHAAKTIKVYDGTASTDTLLGTQTRTDTTDETDWTPS